MNSVAGFVSGNVVYMKRLSREYITRESLAG
jgi:hypothetical protein